MMLMDDDDVDADMMMRKPYDVYDNDDNEDDDDDDDDDEDDMN